MAGVAGCWLEPCGLGLSSQFWWQYHPQSGMTCLSALWQSTGKCHSPALGDPLWRDGERKGFTCLSSLSRWETTVHGVPKGRKERKEHLGRGGAMYPLLVPPTPLNLLCPPLVSVVGFFWHSSGDNWCLIWVLGGKANEGVSMMLQPSPAHSDTRFHPHLSIPRPHPP